MDMLQVRNPFIEIHKTANKRLKHQADSTEQLRMLLSLQMHFVLGTGADRHRENLPTSDEVALIISEEYGQASRRDTVLALSNSPESHPDKTVLTARHPPTCHCTTSFTFLMLMRVGTGAYGSEVRVAAASETVRLSGHIFSSTCTSVMLPN